MFKSPTYINQELQSRSHRSLALLRPLIRATTAFAIPTRRIGDDNVSAIGFGAMGIGNFGYGTELNQDDETRFKVFDRLLELGCTNWDTADV
ncbi:hypothetical protein FRC06_007218, partial [Ceratobasidium sp. 370]